jgi:hypothetical protein
MNISIHQACTVWNDLRDAMEGKASHRNEAEIYAYRLMPNIPTLDMKSIDHSADRIRAAKSLVALIDLFRETYPDYYAFIDGNDYHYWTEKVQANFDHRVKVEIRNLNEA